MVMVVGACTSLGACLHLPNPPLLHRIGKQKVVSPLILQKAAAYVLKERLMFLDNRSQEDRRSAHEATMKASQEAKKARAYERIVRCVVNPAQIKESGMKSLEEVIMFEKKRVEE